MTPAPTSLTANLFAMLAAADSAAAASGSANADTAADFLSAIEELLDKSVAAGGDVDPASTVPVTSRRQSHSEHKKKDEAPETAAVEESSAMPVVTAATPQPATPEPPPAPLALDLSLQSAPPAEGDTTHATGAETPATNLLPSLPAVAVPLPEAAAAPPSANRKSLPHLPWTFPTTNAAMQAATPDTGEVPVEAPAGQQSAESASEPTGKPQIPLAALDLDPVTPEPLSETHAGSPAPKLAASDQPAPPARTAFELHLTPAHSASSDPTPQTQEAKVSTPAVSPSTPPLHTPTENLHRSLRTAAPSSSSAAAANLGVDRRPMFRPELRTEPALPKDGSSEVPATAAQTERPAAATSAHAAMAPPPRQPETLSGAPRAAEPASAATAAVGNAASDQPEAGRRDSRDNPSHSREREPSSTETFSAGAEAQTSASSSSSVPQPPQHAPGATVSATVATPAHEPAVAESAADNRPQAAAAASPARIEPAHIAEPRPVAAPREISLNLGNGSQRVDVRVSERAGEVHVAVRTPDPELTQSLRRDLPELSARIERSGYRAEAWHPPSISTNSAAQAGNDAPPDQGGQRQPQQQGERRQQQQQQQQHPQHRRWNLPEESGNGETRDFGRLISALR